MPTDSGGASIGLGDVVVMGLTITGPAEDSQEGVDPGSAPASRDLAQEAVSACRCWGVHSTSQIAQSLNITDVFALRRVSDEQLVNLAGVGRGEGWAGNISIDPEREQLIASALSGAGLIRYQGPSRRVFGPYWAEEAAVTLVGDFVIVMGGPGVATQADDTLIEAAGDLAWSVGDVPAEKRLADELELTKAALSVASIPIGTIDDFLANLAEAAREALGCEFGAVVLQEPHRKLVFATDSWTPNADDDVVLAAMLRLVENLDLEDLNVAQDVSEDPLSTSPLSFAEGLVSRCLIPISVPDITGAIVVAHTVETPRGFTNLCQQVAVSMGDQASRVLTSNYSPNSREQSVVS